MIQPRDTYRETQFRPQAAKTLRQTLIRFIQREFPRLGGPWVVELFVDKLLQLVDTYRITRDRLKPGQTLWQTVAINERTGYRKPMTETRQVPVVITVADQEEVADLRSRVKRRDILQRGLVRAANDAYAQGGVVSVTDLALLFNHSQSWISQLIREYEVETGNVVPRRGNVHDLGRTVTHKWIICRKAYLEGKLTPTIARETFHSPGAVDNYILGLARVHFATVRQGMSTEEAAFALQQPVYIVQEYIKMIDAFGLDGQSVYDRVGEHTVVGQENTEPPLTEAANQQERREQELIPEQPVPAFPLG